MKKIEIILGGTGHEITRSNFTCEELKKVREYCEENDDDMESVLTNDLEEVLEDRGQWYDCDDLGHFMGGNLNCKLYVTVNDEEYVFETGDEEKMFGSVTNLDIHKALTEKDIEIDRQSILLDKPIKELGVHSVPIKLSHGKQQEIKVYVIQA